jgi:hypothetical protein
MKDLNEIALFTDFDSDRFDQGMKWVRAAKSFGTPPTVIDHGLTDDQMEKLKELRVRLVDPVVKTGSRPVDAWHTLVRHATGPSCYCDLTAIPDRTILGAWDGKGIGAVSGDLSSFALLNPIVAISSRVKLFKAMEDSVFKTFGGYFLPSIIVGDLHSWTQLAGLAALLTECGVTDTVPGLRALNLNLYAAYTSRVQALPGKS